MNYLCHKTASHPSNKRGPEKIEPTKNVLKKTSNFLQMTNLSERIDLKSRSNRFVVVDLNRCLPLGSACLAGLPPPPYTSRRAPKSEFSRFEKKIFFIFFHRQFFRILGQFGNITDWFFSGLTDYFPA